MAFTVTARQSGNSGTTAAQTLTTNSATPTANSLFIAAWGQENNASATSPSYQTPTGGSLTYTVVNSTGTTDYPWNGDSSFRVGTAVYQAAVGASPSAFTVTVDSSSTTATFFYGAVCFDITGHDTTTPIVNSGFTGASKGGTDTETGSITLGWTPSVGNLVVTVWDAGADVGGGFATPTAGTGKTFTAVTNQTTAYCQTGVFYRVWDGTESATISCSDLGQSVGNFSVVAFEVKAAAGGGVTGTAAVTQANNTASASGVLGYSGSAAVTQANNTSTASGTVTAPGVSGSAAVTQQNNTASASGLLGYAGTAAVTQAGNTATASGTSTPPGSSGSVAAVQANQTSSASGVLGYTGSAAASQAGQTAAASGKLGYSGSASSSQAAQTSTASGAFTAGGSFSGSAAVTQAAQTASASGQLGYSGSAATTQAGNTSAAIGTVVNPVTGSASAAQANQVSTASGVLRYSGTAAAVEATDTASGSGTVTGPVTGLVAVTQANQTATATGAFMPLVLFGTATGATGPAPASSGVTPSAASAYAGAGATAGSSSGSMNVPTATGG